jgi:hypothetical protein
MPTFEKITLAPTTQPNFRIIKSMNGCGLFDRGQWPAKWIHSVEENDGEPHFLLFRKTFKIEEAIKFRVHVSSDERHILWIDGMRLAEGPERGDPDAWYFDSYDVTIEAGEHVILVKVNVLGQAAPRSQTSLRPGFLFCPESPEALELLGTGVGDWEVCRLNGYTFTSPFENEAFSVGHNCTHDAREIDHETEAGGGSDWKKARAGLYGAIPDQRNRYPATHLLYPALLEERRRTSQSWGRLRGLEKIQLSQPSARQQAYAEEITDRGETAHYEALFNGDAPLILPPDTHLRLLLDLEDYFGADYAIKFKGASGAKVSIHFAESLFVDTDYKNKGQRDQVSGKYFFGIGDTFIADGTGEFRNYQSIFWRSGRFIEINIHTGAEPMTIETLELFRVGYPIDWQYNFKSSDASLNPILPLVERTLAASTDDGLMDGPYYEQMLWVGDLIQTSLTHYVTTLDSRLILKAIRNFDASRLPDGLTCARWPARDRMIIPTYSLYWIELIYHYAHWRSDFKNLSDCMPGIRGVIDAFLKMKNTDGLIETKKGWNMVDWVPEWDMGMPPGADGGVSSIINWHFVIALEQAAELEMIFDEPELAQRYQRLAGDMVKALESKLWDTKRGLFKDAPDSDSYSEHAQALAILSGHLNKKQLERIATFTEQPITKATISFNHFVFEALFKLGRTHTFFERLESWKALPSQGFITLPEGPEPSRSDCHEWGAHPLYHLLGSVLGIQPAAPGFKKVVIKPQMGPLSSIQGEIPHPNGCIRVAVSSSNQHLSATVELPEGITGQIYINGEIYELNPGTQTIE